VIYDAVARGPIALAGLRNQSTHGAPDHGLDQAQVEGGGEVVAELGAFSVGGCFLDPAREVLLDEASVPGHVPTEEACAIGAEDDRGVPLGDLG